MNAMLFAAGLGTRLRPITDTCPKALVPIAGKPLMDYVLARLRQEGCDNIVVNAHHLAEQIVNHLQGTDIKVSLETELLDTGGGLKRAMPLFGNADPILVHNVDILSNAHLHAFYDTLQGSDVCLLVSRRQTSRYILFDDDMQMVGWTNTDTGEVRSPYTSLNINTCHKYAFAGIHVVSQRISTRMDTWGDRFAIVDFYIQHCKDLSIKGVIQDDLRLIDVGKIDSLEQAADFIKKNNL